MPNDHRPARGDELLPAANLTFDRRRLVRAAPEQIWPWLLQLGKKRAGWYLPARVEMILPASRRASRVIEDRYQQLVVGERIPDYGGRDAWLEVAVLDPPTSLIYRSDRGKASFTWALVLTPVAGSQTEVSLRFRGQLSSRPALRRVIVVLGGFMDWSTSELMLRGLAERVEQGLPH